MSWLFYTLVYTPAYTLFLLAMGCLAPFSPKIRRAFRGRIGLTRRVASWTAEDPTHRPFWFHVASSGEIEQCLPILDSLREQSPESRIFLSYFSPTAARALTLETERRARSGRTVPWDYADYSPFDLGPSVRRFLAALRPRCFVAIHRELWPRLVEECRQRRIPCYLFATHFPPGTEKRWRLLPARILQHWLGDFRGVGTTEARSAAALSRLLPEVPVAPLGDPRVERVMVRKQMHKPMPWLKHLEGQKIVLLASVWDEDFAALQPALQMLFTEFPDWRVILTPHEPETHRLRAWEKWLIDQRHPGRRWSEWLEAPDPKSVLLVDGVGFLAELYRVASIVFVGGSFKGRVHNVLEPAAYGCPIVTGPFIANSAEATELSAGDRGLVKVGTPEALADALRRLLSAPESRAEYSARLAGFLDERRGAGRRYAELLLKES